MNNTFVKITFAASLLAGICSSSFAADKMACTDKAGKPVELKSKEDKDKEKECKTQKGSWMKAAKAAETPKKEEASGKSGGW